MNKQWQAVLFGMMLLAARAPVADAAPAAGPAVVDWARGVVVAQGVAEGANQALVDARRRAMEAIGGIAVTSETTVGLYLGLSDTLRDRVTQLVAAARVVAYGAVADTTNDTVLVEVPLGARPDGSPGLFALVVPEVRALEAKAIARRDASPHIKSTLRGEPDDGPPPAPVALPPRKPGPYTGLIIEASGYQLMRCMCPRILRPNGSEVWGTVDVTSEFVQEHGIAGFAPSLTEALDPKLNPRVGANPLIIRAVGRQGTVWANALVSDDDAKLILAEDAKTKFLAGFKVTFVIGEPAP